MRNSSRKCVRLALLGGFFLVALLYFWKPSSKEVDISPRQDAPIKKLFTGKIGDATNGYKDISYHIKEEVARCAIVTIFFFFSSFSSYYSTLCYFQQSFGSKCLRMPGWWRNLSPTIFKSALSTRVGSQSWSSIFGVPPWSWKCKAAQSWWVQQLSRKVKHVLHLLIR